MLYNSRWTHVLMYLCSMWNVASNRESNYEYCSKLNHYDKLYTYMFVFVYVHHTCIPFLTFRFLKYCVVFLLLPCWICFHFCLIKMLLCKKEQMSCRFAENRNLRNGYSSVAEFVTKDLLTMVVIKHNNISNTKTGPIDRFNLKYTSRRQRKRRKLLSPIKPILLYTIRMSLRASWDTKWRQVMPDGRTSI